MQKTKAAMLNELLTAAEQDEILAKANQNEEAGISIFDGKKPRFTISHLEAHLNEKKITIRYNLINRKSETLGISSQFTAECCEEILAAILFDELQHKYSSISIDKINQYLAVVVAKNAYNPVENLLNKATWDGCDRLPQMYNILSINDDELSKTLLQKWLIQCISLAHNELDTAFGADGILVLTGNQGIGKTSFFRKLAIMRELFGEGKSINFNDKDTFRRATSFWITELGEIETTLKSDIEKLKAFVTDAVDLYRLPYGRKDSEHPRRASLCGTCNSLEYLIDPSGNRRFWSIPVEEIDLKKLSEFDSLQLWAQIVALHGWKSQAFRLTRDEQKALSERNCVHEKGLKAENEIRDIFYMAENSPNAYSWMSMTITDFISHHERIKGYSAQQVTAVLDKLQIPKDNDGKPHKMGGKAVRTRRLPKWNYHQ